METTPQGIGDLQSAAIGSGARFNSGKPAVELLPFSELARFYHFRNGDPDSPPTPAIQAMYYLGEFQEGGDITPLLNIVNILGRDGGIMESARVFDYGRKKYAEWNWAKGMPWSVPIGCAGRHLIDMIDLGWGVLDSESGWQHRGHVLCNVWMLILYSRTYPQGDDRPPRELFAGTVYGAPPAPAPAPAVTELPFPSLERRAPRPKDADLLKEAARAINDFGVHLQGDDAAPNAASYKTWTPEACWELKGRLRGAAREGSQ